MPTSTPSTDVQSIWRQKTMRLLDTPIGALDDKLWNETHVTILWWLNSCLDHNLPTLSSSSATSSSVEATECIHQAFELLDRLYREEQAPIDARQHERRLKSTSMDDVSATATLSGDNDTVMDMDCEMMNIIDTSVNVPEFFNEELLNLVVNRWRKLISSRRLLMNDSAQEEQNIPQYIPRNLLERLYRYQKTSTSLQPDCQTYAMVIDSISSMVQIEDEGNKRTEKEDLMAAVDEIIDWLVDQAGDNKSDKIENSTEQNELLLSPPPLSQQQRYLPKPNVVLFSSAMNAWTKSGLSGAPDRVEKLLQKMETLQERYPEWGIKPNKFTYSTAIDAWAKVKRVDKVQHLLQKMYKQAAIENDPSLKPGLPAFNGYLVALAKSGRAEEAEALLSQMEDLYDSGELEEPPSVISYSTVIDSFARSNLEGASMRAESFLRRMINREDLVPNAVSYNSVINAHVKSWNIEAAEAVLREMHDNFLNSGDMEIRPTIQSYSSVISGIAKSRQKDSGERAERILEQLKEMAQSGDLDKPPDVILYNSVLDCWAKSSSTPEMAARAVMFLEKMKNDGIAPDAISYNTTINCLAQAGKVHDAELMLEDMEGVGVYPNSITYNTLLSAYLRQSSSTKSKKHEKKDQSSQSRKICTTNAENLFEKMRNDPRIEPDVVTYNTMLHFHSRIGDIEKAESLLKEMFLEDTRVTPDSTSLNTVINAWANSGRIDAPQRAEAILEQMLKPNIEGGGNDVKINPTSITFNSVMSAWTKTRKPEAAERCQNIFDLMTNDMGHIVQPDFITFNIMIHAWSLSYGEEAPDQAEAILSEMHRRFKAGNSRMRPNAKTYGSLISVWSKSRRPEAGQKAEEYLRQIIHMSDGDRQRSNSIRRFGRQDDQPRVFEFTATIRAWHNSGDPIASYKADEILYLLLEQVKKGNKRANPDTKLFLSFLLTLASSTIPNKDIYANRVIQMMIEYKIGPNNALMDQLKRCYQQQDKNPIQSVNNTIETSSTTHVNKD
jgi:pentatricopeptide repeat protein